MDACQGEGFPQEPKKQENTLLYFVWSPPWHLYIFLLANLLAFYLAYLLAFYLAYLLAYAGIFSGILSGKPSGILSGISSGILSDLSSGILSGISSGILSDLSSGILSGNPFGRSSGIPSGRWGPAVPTAIWKSGLRSGSAHCDLEFAVEVRQCPLRSGSRGWGPAVPTATWKSRLRSGSAHCDQEFAVEVRQCPLGSGIRRWGPAVPTAIWKSRLGSGLRGGGGGGLRSGSRGWDLDRRRRRRWRTRMRRRRRRTALIKSNDPHLAGGKKQKNEQRTLLDWKRANTSKKKNRPRETVWGQTGQVTWGYFFVFPWGLVHFWAKAAKTSRKIKKIDPRRGSVFFLVLPWVLGPRLQKPRENKKIDPRRGSEEKLGRWHSVIFFVFVLPLVLEHSWAKVAKTSRKLLKKSAHGDGLRKNWTGENGVFLFFHWFWTSRFSFQDWRYLYENFG